MDEGERKVKHRRKGREKTIERQKRGLKRFMSRWRRKRVCVCVLDGGKLSKQP